MTGYRIPFNRPCLVGQELAYVRDAIQGGHIAGNGQYTARCSEILEREIGCRRALLTTSCTHALEMCALLLDIGPGDEVLVPSFTFVSTANAFVLRGARPAFVDIRPDTLNIDEALVDDLVGSRSRALVAVHYAGVGCEMDSLEAVARRRGLTLIEDNAHGIFGHYRGRPLGSFGRLATQSFHETKNVSCGEGGALIVNDPSLTARAEVLREKGTDRSRFYRGEVDKYTWVDVGSSYLPSDLLAAFLLAQLENRERIQCARQRIWRAYYEGLRSWAQINGVALPRVPVHVDQAYHMFYLVLPSREARARLIEHLKARGILAVFHYVPLHLSPMGRRFGGREGACPVTESVSDRLLRLPFYNDLSRADQDDVIESVLAFRC